MVMLEVEVDSFCRKTSGKPQITLRAELVVEKGMWVFIGFEELPLTLDIGGNASLIGERWPQASGRVRRNQCGVLSCSA